MQSEALTIEDYLAELPADRKPALEKLFAILSKNIPAGFQSGIGYGHIGFVVPHELYPAGYHVTPHLPLPFLGIASQKNHIAVYHMWIYMIPELLAWFTEEFRKHSKKKLDMGKSCIRFRKEADIPFELFAELATKISVEDYIVAYEKSTKK
ncbi:DUF1801 domain-containing protein [Sphingobacterium hungaricum]